MKLSIACLAAAAALFALLPAAQAQSWQRSGMKQGYYAAYTGNADGARLRIDCGQSDEVLSITYIPRRAPASARNAAGAIVIDGRRFAGSFEVAGDEIKVGPTISTRSSSPKTWSRTWATAARSPSSCRSFACATASP